MIATILAILIAALPLRVQELPHAFPREGAKQLFDNERVTVWDVTLEKGRPTPMHRHRYDFVRVELANSTSKVTSLSGVAQTVNMRFGQAFFSRKGTAEMQEGLSDLPRHMIIIDLKDVVLPPLANTSGHPLAFPREGAQKLIDNARVTVWDLSWTPGRPTPMHFHDKDVVAVYLGDGSTSSTTPEGVTTVNPHFPGEAKFNPRNRTHSELLPAGMQRVIAVELK